MFAILGFCSPILPLLILMLAVVVACVFAIRWQSPMQDKQVDHFRRTSFLLGGLLLLSLLSLSTFLGYSFFHLAAC